MTKKKRSKHLVVGDAHVTNNQNLRRFDWLNGYLNSDNNCPDYLVFIGDFLTLNSLSAWDRDKRLLMEDRRFFKEIDAGNAALDKLQIPNNTEVIFIEGNHEERLPRYLNYHPEWADGLLTIPTLLRLNERGFRWIPYRTYWVHNGLHFTHIPFGKAREVGGKDICSKVEAVTVNTTIFGHTHELHTSCVHKHGQRHLQQILNVGCFFEQEEDYVHGRVTNYWKGLVELDNYDYGRFDIKTIAMGSLEREYGRRVA